ncbi:MAG: permease [Clostridia bacterium]|nr:permease [Clostridia bacterium]
MEKENLQTEQTEFVPAPKKKSLKWLWITIALVVVAGIAVWCAIASTWGKDVYDKFGDYQKTTFGISNIISIAAFLVGIFIITALGYLLGRVTIKGVSLGTAGVFLVAILFGFLCTLIPENMPVLGALHLQAEIVDKVNNEVIQKASTNLPYYKSALQNVGLVLFVGSVGFIAGPKFFRDLKKNFKTYIVMGIVIILVGTLTAVVFALIPEIGPEYSAGILSGALTSTPGYSAALEVAGESAGLVTLGHAVAYPFGVIGVVLFVQLMPKFMKANMEHERGLLKPDVLASTEKKTTKKLFKCDDFGLMPLALAIVSGLLIGAIKIPLTGKGYNGACFSLGTTGGVLIMCLVFGHFGRIGRLSLEVPAHSAKVLRELGLMLFLIGAGVDGGVNLVSQVASNGGGRIVAWGFLGGAVMTLLPMVVGFFLGKKLLKLPLLSNLGSITGGMTSTPALGTLINTAETDDVAGAYASTYPIALVLIVLACNLMIGLL